MSTERELQALFRAEQAVSPSTHAVNHGWQRLATDLAANVAPLPVSTGALKLGTWLIPKWLLVGFTFGLLGAGAAAPLLGVRAEPSQVSAPSERRIALRAPTTQATLPTPNNHEAVLAPPAPSVEARVAREPATMPTSSTPTTATFDAELKLISFAKEELDAQHPRQARAWLDEHLQRFPNGVFAVEREALVVLASCQQGPKSEALASAFAKRHPGSPLVSRLERACRPHADFSSSLNGSAKPGEPIAEPSQGSAR